MSTNIEQPTPHTAAEGQEGAATCLLSSAYFPPVQWMQKLHRYGHAIVERCDNFTKQTYRKPAEETYMLPTKAKPSTK